MIDNIEIYCDGSPDRSGAPTHPRWIVAVMGYAESDGPTDHFWMPDDRVTRRSELNGNPVVSYPGPKWSGTGRMKQSLVNDEVVDLDRNPMALYDDDFRVKHQFSCLAPLPHNKRGCGLHLPVRKWSSVNDLLDVVSSAGVSEMSLHALVRRLTRNT